MLIRWVVLPLLLLLLTAAPAAAQRKPLAKEFEEALRVFYKSKKKAIPKLKHLVDRRWKELSAKGRHGVGTLLMFCYVSEGKTAKARQLGARLHRELKGSFLGLSRLSGKSADKRGVWLREDLDLVSLRVGAGQSIIYLHNASKQAIDLDLASSALLAKGTWQNRKTKGELEPKKPAFVGKLLRLPAEGGVILRSPAGAAPDAVTLLAWEATKRLPGWIHLVIDGYRQEVTTLRITARVRSGKPTWEELRLVDLDRKRKGPKLNRNMQRGLAALERGAWAEAHKSFDAVLRDPDRTMRNLESVRWSVAKVCNERKLVDWAEEAFLSRKVATAKLRDLVQLLDAWLPGVHPDKARAKELLPKVLARFENPDRALVSLKHVQVGQVYTFDLQGSLRMTWEVTRKTKHEVHYLLRTYAAGNNVGAPKPQVWKATTWTAPDGAQRRGATVSGVRFDCLVVKAEGLTSWTAVEGELPTFPGPIRAMKDKKTVLNLVAIEQPTDAKLLAHVKVGQRYRFVQGSYLTEWRVDSIKGGRVAYTVTTSQKGKVVDTSKRTWSAKASRPIQGAPTRERMVIDGVELECVVRHMGRYGSWTAVVGNTPTFPGAIKLQEGQKVTFELIGIQAP